MALRLRHPDRGQAAVEAMFAIPVLLIFFLIGLQLFVLAFNAQYANVKSRYTLMANVNHAPCPGAQQSQSITIHSTAIDFGVPGEAYMQEKAGGFSQTSTATIVCK